jgi:hypothetical protein
MSPDGSQQVKELCFEIGRTLLACNLVERHLHDLLAFFDEPFDVSAWLDRDARRDTLHNSIRKLERRFGFTGEVFDVLDKFRRDRNKFIHETWRLSSSMINTENGRVETLMFVRALYLDATALNSALWPCIAGYYRQLAPLPTDWGALPPDVDRIMLNKNGHLVGGRLD